MPAASLRPLSALHALRRLHPPRALCALRRLIGLAVLTAPLLAPAALHAQQAWPQRPIKIVVPYAAGASSDLVTRRIARGLSERLGQSVVVENKIGARGQIAMVSVVREKPDGYTFAANDTGYVMLPHLVKEMPYDPAKDLVPVAGYVFSPFGILVHADSPYKTLQDLIRAGRASPGKLTYGSGGEGTTPHLTSEAFAHQAGFTVLHVPYKGAADAVMALMGGQIDFQFATPTTAAANVKAGRLRMLAISGETRSKLLPDVPTFAEAGMKDFSVTNWIGLWAPRGTPQPILERLAREISAIMVTADMKTFAEDSGAAPNFAVGEDFVRLVKEEDARWKSVIEKIGIEKK